MNRRPFAAWLLVAGIVVMLSDAGAPRANAQGLLRRIQSRIQERLPDPAATPGTQAEGPSAPQPRRLRPLQADGDEERRRTPLDGRNLDRGLFGGSILKPLLDPDAADPDAAAEPKRAANSATLGIDVLPSRSSVEGAEVVKIKERSRAKEAGLRVGDVIVGIDNQPTPTIADVARQLKDKAAGETVQARVVRGQSTIDLAIPLIARDPPAAAVNSAKPPADLPTPPEAPAEYLPTPPTDSEVNPAETLGVRLKQNAGVRGAVVTEVVPGSPADAAGLKTNDRIVAVDGKMVMGETSLRQQLGTDRESSKITLRLVRGDELVNADVDLNGSVGSDSGTVADGGKKDSGGAAGSALQGFGSVLGGLFGANGGKSAAADSGVKDAQPSSDQPEAPQPPEPETGADSQPIRKTGFEAGAAEPAAEPSVGLGDDPPSLSVLELPPPPPNAVPMETKGDAPEPVAETIRRLREEIRRLEARLKQLEGRVRRESSAQ